MSDKEWYLEDYKPSLRKWIFQNMAMGATYAALVLFGLIAIILIINAIGKALPDESKEAADPNRVELIEPVTGEILPRVI